MPLIIRRVGGLSCPTFVCDLCGSAIERGDEGNYEWDMLRDDAPIYFTHKRCCRAFEASHHAGHWGAMGLDLLPVYAKNVLGVDMKRAEECARLLGGLLT